MPHLGGASAPTLDRPGSARSCSSRCADGSFLNLSLLRRPPTRTRAEHATGGLSSRVVLGLGRPSAPPFDRRARVSSSLLTTRSRGSGVFGLRWPSPPSLGRHGCGISGNGGRLSDGVLGLGGASASPLGRLGNGISGNEGSFSGRSTGVLCGGVLGLGVDRTGSSISGDADAKTAETVNEPEGSRGTNWRGNEMGEENSTSG